MITATAPVVATSIIRVVRPVHGALRRRRAEVAEAVVAIATSAWGLIASSPASALLSAASSNRAAES